MVYIPEKLEDNIYLKVEQIVFPLAGSPLRSGQNQSSEHTGLEVVELCEWIQKQAYVGQKEVLGSARQIF